MAQCLIQGEVEGLRGVGEGVNIHTHTPASIHLPANVVSLTFPTNWINYINISNFPGFYMDSFEMIFMFSYIFFQFCFLDANLTTEYYDNLGGIKKLQCQTNGLDFKNI